MKDENYYLNQCSSETEIGRDYTKYGYNVTHSIEDKIVTLHFYCYSNGDDYDDELVEVEIKTAKSLLENLRDAVNLKPMSLLGK
jgi:hypothetical protein